MLAAPQWRSWLRQPIIIISIVAVLFFILTGIYFALRPRIPAAGGFVTITPMSHIVDNSYDLTLKVGDNNDTNNPLAAHRITRSTAPQSVQVPATGKRHEDATRARGKVSVIVQQGKIPDRTDFNITSNSGVKIVLLSGGIKQGDGTSDKPFQFDATAQDAGAGGNIAANDINGPYRDVQDPSLLVYVQNPEPFSGGQDAGDYSFVQQSDIDAAAGKLQEKVGNDTSAVQSEVQKQLPANEQFMNGVQCSPHTSSNHKANDKAQDVTVAIQVDCMGIAYSLAKLTTLATEKLSAEALTQYGDKYALVGNVSPGIDPNSVTDKADGMTSYKLAGSGLWVFQITDQLKRQYADSIAGQPQNDAAYILQKLQQGIAKADIQVSGGLGTALPTSSANIQINIVNVQPT